VIGYTNDTPVGWPTPDPRHVAARQRFARAQSRWLAALATAPLRQLEALDAEIDDAARALRAVGGWP
jgi:hypothetical protein